MKVKSESEVAQSCPTLRAPMDCSLSGSSVHGIFQARVPEWVAISFSKIFGYLASLVAQVVKASAYNVGDPGSIPGWRRSLEKEIATHSSILAWKIPWTEEPDR